MVNQSVDIRAHFGLSALPFTRELPIEKRWKNSQFEQVLGALKQAVEHRMSAALVAVAGSGKTVLLRALRDELPEARYRVSYVKVTNLAKRDFCGELARAIGCRSAGQFNSLVRNIQEHVSASSGTDGVRPVLILDEAHDMAPQVLAILRILTNFDMDSRLMLSVILAGQLRLGTTLKRPELEAVAGRMSHYATLRNLGAEEVRAYVKHRVTICGARQSLFTDGAFEALFEMASGNLRATDTLAFKALHLAASKKSSVVDANDLAEARMQVLL